MSSSFSFLDGVKNIRHLVFVKDSNIRVHMDAAHIIPGTKNIFFVVFFIINRILLDRALQRRTQRQPTPRGRRPPLYPRGGGSSLWPQKNESGQTGLWMDSPERATGVGVGPMRWIVHVSISSSSIIGFLGRKENQMAHKTKDKT